MEADRDAIREARAAFATDIGQLKATVTNAGHRLQELERGRRIAVAAESVRRLKTGRFGRAPARQAQPRSPMPRRRCSRLRQRQTEDCAADISLRSPRPWSHARRAASVGWKPRVLAAAPAPRHRRTGARRAESRPPPQPPHRRPERCPHHFIHCHVKPQFSHRE